MDEEITGQVEETKPARTEIPDDDIPAKKKKPHRVLRTIALLLVCAIISSICGATAARVMFNRMSDKLTAVTESYSTEAFTTAFEEYTTEEAVLTTETTTEEITEATTEETTIPTTTAPPTTKEPETTLPSKSSIYSTAVYSVVGVLATYDYTIRTILGSVTRTHSSTGTGFYVASGYVVTNAHVIENGVYIKVTDYDGNTHNAKVVATMSNNDVAILKIDEATPKLYLGSSSELKVGDDCMIIGNPMGNLSYTYTDGMVSYCNRTITTDSGYTLNMYQTNAAINAGNSGGPVFNNKGEVVGIATAKYSTQEGLSFFIPIDDVRTFIYSHIG